MISYISGSILSKSKHSLTVMTAGGVGYEIAMTPLRLVGFGIGQEIELFTYLRVTDQAHDLYGFVTAEERQFFSLLMTVSGVGPKTALNVLSLGSIDHIKDAIARGDVKYLTAVQGLGKKTAERLVVELKSKVGLATETGEQEGGIMGDAIDALVSLGYSKDEARAVVQKIDAADATSEQILREALKLLSK